MRLEGLFELQMKRVMYGVSDPTTGAFMKSKQFEQAERPASISTRKKEQKDQGTGPYNRLRVYMNLPQAELDTVGKRRFIG